MAIQWPWQKLRAAGIIGMNQRNADYVMRYNKRSLYPYVDDKRLTKQLALNAGIAVPPLYGDIEVEHDVHKLSQIIKHHSDFVLKPAQGSGGNGILVICERRKDVFIKGNGQTLNLSQLEHHVSNILSGMYSLGGSADCAMIEYRVQFDPLFESVSHGGVPDIRTLVFKGVPVAAMVRLPTRQSDGKANLHQGAIGAGIDMGSGCTMRSVHHNKMIDAHPDTGERVEGIQIPAWADLLETAARCRDLVALDYMGVDMVLDRQKGPLMLELNARPGLNIQLANGVGLETRLKTIEDMTSIPETARERAELAMDLFSSNINPADFFEPGAGIQARLF